mmetsp:Transcript_28935/g.93591  ORF Transcript_28935/g.93591 Transcript_28935/m.93591 type:complete len:197 (+) Transcript_28935:93-683(+)
MDKLLKPSTVAEMADTVKKSMGSMSTKPEHQTDAEAVREFTMEAGQPTPDRPIPMTTDEVKFISKMILDETMELLATVMSPAESKSTLKAMIDVSEDLPKEKYDQATEAERDIHKCADQADALVDVYYYSLNAAAKKGMNLSAVFGVVHGANMAKRNPATGKFEKRESDGKIIKPPGWSPPDVEGELKRQLAEGSF